jgi:peptide/nickel transport system permease protein
LDLAAHLVLPVLTLALAPCIVVTRYVRDGVARAARAEFAVALRAWGMPERTVRRRALHHGLSPLITLLGVLLPALVSGSVVVESVFALPGLGRLAFDAALRQEQAMVMTMTLLVGSATLLGMLLSDILHRAVDPRVELR